MNTVEFKNIIDRMARECVSEQRTRAYVRKLVKEALSETSRGRINEAEDNDSKRNSVMKLLKNPKFSHAYLAYSLWHPKDDSEKDTYRSLFSKKANGEPDNDGVVRSFTDDEINKLYELMRKN